MKKIHVIIISIVVAITIIAISAFIWYKSGINAVNKENGETKVVEIEKLTRTEAILDLLVNEKLIKNKYAAGLYMKLHGVKGLQAGKYELSQKMSLEEILKKISYGDIQTETVKITFKEGKNIRWIAKTIAEKTNNSENDVYELLENKDYIKELIDKYWFLTDDILNENIYYPLEGYLYPETYEFENKDVTVKTIFNIMLNHTDKILSEYKSEIENQGAKTHQVLTLASIIELEGKDKESRKGIASVFFNRLKSKMSLGSDVTTYYASKIDMSERNLTKEEINSNNPYNTRGPGMAGKLPVGPISNPSKESIEAVLNPASTNYLYFVSDSNDKIYFTKTYEEHKNIIKKLQSQGLWYEYDN